MTELNDIANHPDITSLQRKCVLGYLYLMICNILIASGTAWLLLFYPPFCFFMFILLVIHILGLYLVYCMPVYKWRTLAVAIIFCVMIALIPIIMIAHVLGSLMTYFWLLIPPLAYYMMYPAMKTSNIIIFFGSVIFLIITIITITINMMIPILAPLFQEWHTSVVTNKMPLSSMFSIIYPLFAVPVFIFYFLYYMLRISELKATILAVNNSRDYDVTERLDDSTVDKCYELYDIIVEYFEREKPYLDPNFSISQLSFRLNSNNSYMSRAIKLKKNMSFATFVNTYRIERVKEMIRNNRDVYTIEYIYTSSGFANQSTFNKAFKQIEGVTPSEFAAK